MLRPGQIQFMVNNSHRLPAPSGDVWLGRVWCYNTGRCPLVKVCLSSSFVFSASCNGFSCRSLSLGEPFELFQYPLKSKLSRAKHLAPLSQEWESFFPRCSGSTSESLFQEVQRLGELNIEAF